MSRFSKVVIVGGGAAGWLTALYVNKISPSTDVTLVESESIGILGAGEGSVPTLTEFLDFLEIDEKEFVKQTNATHKIGILFDNWNGDKKDYFHSFNVAHQKFDYAYDDNGELINAFVGSLYIKELPYTVGDIAEQMARANKSPFIKHSIDRTNQIANYSFHFDAHLVAEYLKKVAIQRGIKRVENIVQDFTQDSSGNITEVHLLDSKLECDFVFDCSGFRRRIIGELFNSPWKSYTDHLKLNTALTFQIPQFENKIEPYTKAICMKNGWMWQIPLQNRIGCGYVFDKNYITEEQAQQEVEEYLGHSIQPNLIIPFEAGAYQKVWINNCLAIGLSSAFTEPIEATSIFNAINQLWTLGEMQFKMYNQNFIDQYNNYVNKMNDGVLDFLYFHYITKRNDSEFWQNYQKTTVVPPSLKILLDKWNTSLYKIDDFFQHPFNLHSWLQVGYGLDLFNKEVFIKEFNKINLFRIGEHYRYLKEWGQKITNNAILEKDYLK